MALSERGGGRAYNETGASAYTACTLRLIGWAKRSVRTIEIGAIDWWARFAQPTLRTIFRIASEAKRSRNKKEVWIASSPSAHRNDGWRNQDTTLSKVIGRSRTRLPVA
jgi:hypothetical protein